MKRYIVTVGKECSEKWTREKRRKYNRIIRDFLTRIYPQAYDSLVWNGSSDKGVGGYGISENGEYFEYFLAGEVPDLVEKCGYEVLTRDQIMYSQNLQNILKE